MIGGGACEKVTAGVEDDVAVVVVLMENVEED